MLTRPLHKRAVEIAIELDEAAGTVSLEREGALA